ncbi:hypothetical protein [Helicobacter pylori]
MFLPCARMRGIGGCNPLNNEAVEFLIFGVKMNKTELLANTNRTSCQH